MKGNPSCGQYIEQFTWLIPVYGQWWVFWQDGQGLRRIELENEWHGNLRKRYVDRPLWIGNKHKDSHVPCEYLPEGNCVNAYHCCFFFFFFLIILCLWPVLCIPVCFLSSHPSNQLKSSWTKWPEWQGQKLHRGFPGSSAGKEASCNAGGPSSIPGSGRSTREGIG